jgi:hypothetical protein
MMKYKIWDKENREFWPDIFTAEDLAKSHRFPSNLECFYEIIPSKRAKEIERINDGLRMLANQPLDTDTKSSGD